ncbi:3-oxoacyl-ACP synthase III family protein [Nocardia brasiliensis]|uniref:3-oxoacyl-ACP synthase III family protein n=1 Tax=Nocardia brasiliensis TaxID=37326 RepID=UPI003D91C43A
MVLSRIESIGTYVPERVVTTEELVGRLDPEFRFDLERITGIRERRVHRNADGVIEDSCALASTAARQCLDNSRYTAEDLDIVISTSITRTVAGTKFYYEPSFALLVRNTIGAHDAKYFDITNACAGMSTGVLILDSMIRAGLVRRGLVVSGEQITPIAETAVREISKKYDPHFAALTVGDAGAAVLLDAEGSPGDSIEFIDMMTSAEYADLCIGMPSDRNQGIAMYTDNRAMQNEERYLQGIRRLRDYLATRGSSFEREGFDFVIHHQFSKPALEYVNSLMVREYESPQPEHLTSLEKYGNTASTSHFVVLHDHLKRGEIPPGSKVLIVPSASGMVYGTISVSLREVGV